MQQLFFRVCLTILRRLFNEKFIDFSIKPYIWKYIVKSQNDNEESYLISQIIEKNFIDPSFIEFGYGTYELNCGELIKKNFKGLLIEDKYKLIYGENKHFEAFFAENKLRKKMSQLSLKQQFELISDLKTIEV